MPYKDPEAQKAHDKARQATPEGKAKAKISRQTYQQTPKYKARRKAERSTPQPMWYEDNVKKGSWWNGKRWQNGIAVT